MNKSVMWYLGVALAAAPMLPAMAGPFDTPPTFAVGEVLEFRKIDPNSGVEQSHWKLTAKSVTPQGVTFAGENAGKHYTYALHTSLNPYTPPDPKETARFFDWPLVPGKSWSYQVAEPGKEPRTVQVSVVGEDTVTTDAGTFQAIKLHYRGTWEEGTDHGEWEEYAWYAPQAKFLVKREHIGYSMKHRRTASWTQLLTRYQATP